MRRPPRLFLGRARGGRCVSDGCIRLGGIVYVVVIFAEMGSKRLFLGRPVTQIMQPQRSLQREFRVDLWIRGFLANRTAVLHGPMFWISLLSFDD